ncbi:MtrAB system accessory lipoprotein LpqB [Aeromicrobium panaciterrae]
MLVALATVVLVGACGGIPTSGPVTRVKDDGGLGESTVQYAPALPKAGATPQEIVLGYVDAMLAFPVSTGTASAFLTPAAAKSWRPLDGVRVYARPKVSDAVPDRSTDVDGDDDAGDRVVVQLTSDQVARLDQQGRYSRLSGDAELTYVLQQVKGEWRIATPQSGMMVSSKYFADHFRSFDIFMFDRPGRRLLPVPVYLAVGDQLATSLVASLARGPADDLGDLTRTYVPPQDTLRPSVPVSADGVADVEFDADLRTSAESVQDRLSAQIVWTLRQVPGIRGVRLSGGANVIGRSGLPVQPIDSWGAFGPSMAGTHAYALSHDTVVQIDDGEVAPLTGLWGKNAHGAERIAVSDSGVAGVLKGRSEVRVTNRAGNAARTFAGNQILTPRWDRDGVLWLVDRFGGDTRVRLVRDETLSTPPIGKLADLDINTFTLSPGGSRYAVTTSTGVHVGLIERNDKNQITGLAPPVRVPIDAAKPSSAVWTTDTQLAFLAGSDVSRQVQLVSIDGSVPNSGPAEALLPDVGADLLVLGSGDPAARYATDITQRLWYLPPGGTWHLVKTPTVTGLTYGR